MIVLYIYYTLDYIQHNGDVSFEKKKWRSIVWQIGSQSLPQIWKQHTRIQIHKL